MIDSIRDIVAKNLEALNELSDEDIASISASLGLFQRDLTESDRWLHEVFIPSRLNQCEPIEFTDWFKGFELVKVVKNIKHVERPGLADWNVVVFVDSGSPQYREVA